MSDTSYVDQTAALLGIPLSGERRTGVVAAFAAFSDAAALLMNFPRIAASNARLNCFTAVTEVRAVAEAAAVARVQLLTVVSSLWAHSRH